MAEKRASFGCIDNLWSNVPEIILPCFTVSFIEKKNKYVTRKKKRKKKKEIGVL